MAVRNRIRVVVSHNSPVARVGLLAAFGACPDFEVQDCPEFHDGPKWMRPQESCPVDVVVADYARGVALATQSAREDSAAYSPKVIVFVVGDRECEIRSALALGVHGYLTMGCALEDLSAGVRAVHRGARYLSPEVAARLAESIAREPLTTREEEVLWLVVEGLCNKAIGRRLGVAVGTVKSHLKSIFDKLRVGSRTQAVLAAQRCGLMFYSRRPNELGAIRQRSSTPARVAP
jgi:DNA-binding NarL/FixJ family response regulator